jgi:WD40-like Beta Propeller Repeat
MPTLMLFWSRSRCACVASGRTSNQKSRYPCLISALAALLLASCVRDGTTPPSATPGLRIVAGPQRTDSIRATSPQALVVEVRLPSGQAAVGVRVLFEAPLLADTSRGRQAGMSVCAVVLPDCYSQLDAGEIASAQVVADTDGEGRARATVQYGWIAGPGVIRISVSALNLRDSVTYTVTPGAPFRLRAAVRDTIAIIGTVLPLRVAVEDRARNPIANTSANVAWRVSGTSSAIAFDSSSVRASALSFGTATVVARSGQLSDSAIVRVVPRARWLVWSPELKLVRLIDSDGSIPSDVLTGVDTQIGVFPRFNPSRLLVTGLESGSYIGPTTVAESDSGGTTRRRLAEGMGFFVIMAPRLMADGSLFIVASRNTERGFAVWRVDTSGVVSRVAALPEFSVLRYGGADISPDGSRIAYVSSSPTGGSELRVIDVATQASRTVAADARGPRWSPDGSRLAYIDPISPNDLFEFRGRAMLVNADGSNRIALGQSHFATGFAWSPDGAYLLGAVPEDFGGPALRMVRIDDLAEVFLPMRSRNGDLLRYLQPDWR